MISTLSPNNHIDIENDLQNVENSNFEGFFSQEQ
jgi:hypothetical protein